MKKYFISGALALLLFSCNNDNHPQSKTVSPLADSTNKDTSFFPVTSFIKGQLVELDSIQVSPLHITTINNQSDSQWIKRAQLKTFLQPFLEPEIKEKNLLQYFKENSFYDQTIDLITFTYDPISVLPGSMDLRTWDVYIDPHSNNVTKIYIVKELKENNQAITQQLTWQSNTMAEITDILRNPDGSGKLLKQEKFIWNLDALSSDSN